MVALHPEFVVDGKLKKKSVLVSYREWQHIIDALEELDDIHSYDHAKKMKEEVIPFVCSHSKSKIRPKT